MPIPVADHRQFLEFARSGGNRRKAVIETINKTFPIIKALDHPVGQELLTHLITLIEEKLYIIISGDFTEADLASYRDLMKLAGAWAVKIAQYLDSLETVSKHPMQSQQSTTTAGDKS